MNNVYPLYTNIKILIAQTVDSKFINIFSIWNDFSLNICPLFLAISLSSLFFKLHASLNIVHKSIYHIESMFLSYFFDMKFSSINLCLQVFLLIFSTNWFFEWFLLYIIKSFHQIFFVILTQFCTCTLELLF